MPQIAAPVACVLAGLWLAYLVPFKLRHRQQLLESRADDRYSEALRVVAVTRRAQRAPAPRGGQAVREVADRTHAGTTGLLTPGRGLTATTAGRTGGDTMDRPHATGEHVTAEAARRAAQVRAARAAASARRAAAARRRAALAFAMLIATAAGWAAVGLVPLSSWLLGAVPTALLATVLVAGRSAVVAGRRNDAAMAQQIADSEELAANPRSGATRVVVPAVTAPSATVPAASAALPVAAKDSAGGKARTGATAAVGPRTGSATVAARPQSAPTARVTGRAVRPSDAQTEVFTAIVADRGEKGAAARHATGQVPVVAPADEAPAAWTRPPDSASTSDADGWAPVPVPRPTYAMKAAAPRREPIALGEVEASTATRPAADSPSADVAPPAPDLPLETSASIDLNAVLAKRRAAGQ